MNYTSIFRHPVAASARTERADHSGEIQLVLVKSTWFALDFRRSLFRKKQRCLNAAGTKINPRL